MNAEDSQSEDSQHQRRKTRRFELVAVATFVVGNLLAPLVVGEMYPFTVSPMFRDQPQQYCTYQLFDENGTELDLESFGLHLVYDGNPPGLGMGIESSPRMHGFGEVPDLEKVLSHVRHAAIASNVNHARIRVCQSVVCCNGTCPEATVREATITLEPEDRATE